MTKKCVVCKGYILETDKYKKLELVQGPEREETVYVHYECCTPKLLENENIKLNDRCI